MVYNPKIKTPEPLPDISSGAKSEKNTKTRPQREYIFTLLVGSMYIYALSRVIVSSTFIDVTQPRLFFMGVAALVLFSLIFYNRITRIATVGVLALAAIIVLFTLERWEAWGHHFTYIQLMIRGYIAYRPELGMTVLWGISLLLGLATAIFMLYRFSFYVLALTGVAVFLFTWGPGFTRDALPFLLFILCFCLILIRKTNQGVAAVYLAAPICAALVIFINISVPSEAELFQRRTIRELFDGPLSAISDFIHTLTNPMYFSFQHTGFSGEGGHLGGPVTLNSRNVMTVQAPGRTYLAGAISNTYTGYRWHSTIEEGQLYTQGMNASRFEMLETTVALILGVSHIDARSSIPASLLWGLFPDEDHRSLSPRHFPVLGIESFTPDIDLPDIDLILEGARIFSGTDTYIFDVSLDDLILMPGDGFPFIPGGIHYLHSYLPLDQVTIAIGRNRTGTIFRPINTRQLWFHTAGTDYLPDLIFDPIGSIRAPRFMSSGSQYTMNFLNVNRRFLFVEDILRSSYAGAYSSNEHDLGDLTVTVQDINAIFDLFSYPAPDRQIHYVDCPIELMATIEVFRRDVLAPYAETVREHFMEVPDITPQRVYDLVYEIIYGLDNDFDKIMAIRDYLIQFPYTLAPQHVPYGVCFVDHFLFEGQEGYCTYYASAMAVMSRIAGVPSRYVEGFLLPAGDTDPAIFVVTNLMAHAWVEVYLEGYGWLIVEATAPYAFFADPALPVPPANWNPEMAEYEWWLEMMDRYLRGEDDWATTPINPPPITDTTGTTPRGGPAIAHVRLFILIALAVIAAGAFLFLLWRYFRIITAKKRVRNLPTNKQITTYFGGIMDITSHMTTPKDPAETPYAYGQKVGRRFAFRSDSVLLKDLVALYYMARYGKDEMSEHDLELMEDSYFDMVRNLRNENARANFFFLRYIRQVGAI